MAAINCANYCQMIRLRCEQNAMLIAQVRLFLALRRMAHVDRANIRWLITHWGGAS